MHEEEGNVSNRHTTRSSGFTLIELMIVVAILGILAAVAIPAFSSYVRRAKTAEAYGTLDAMFKAVSAYYNRDFGNTPAIDSSSSSHCTVPAATTFLGPATDRKQVFVPSPSFSLETGISLPAGPSYYMFSNEGGTAGCGKPASTSHYTLTARGNLDNDGTSSLFSVVTLSSAANELYKAGAVFVLNELE